MRRETALCISVTITAAEPGGRPSDQEISYGREKLSDFVDTAHVGT